MDPFKSRFQVLSHLRPLLWLGFAGAILLGVWARFASLHAASLAADEYYLLQSVNNILKFGLPQFECGGYYTRGLLHQYLSASFMLLGLEPGEAAIRLPSVLSSLVALAGAFFLARYVAGWRVACLLVTLLSVSLWEVEFARFGRMYALFQAVTVVYAFVTLKYLEGESKQFWWMAALGVLGVLSHEGGLLLVVFTLIAVFVRPHRVSGRHAAVALVMLLAGVKMQVTDFRFLGVEQPYSPQLLATAANPDTTWGPFELPTLVACSAAPGDRIVVDRHRHERHRLTRVSTRAPTGRRSNGAHRRSLDGHLRGLRSSPVAPVCDVAGYRGQPSIVQRTGADERKSASHAAALRSSIPWPVVWHAPLRSTADRVSVEPLGWSRTRERGGTALPRLLWQGISALESRTPVAGRADTGRRPAVRGF